MQNLYIIFNQYHGPSSLLLGSTLVTAGVKYLSKDGMHDSRKLVYTVSVWPHR